MVISKMVNKPNTVCGESIIFCLEKKKSYNYTKHEVHLFFPPIFILLPLSEWDRERSSSVTPIQPQSKRSRKISVVHRPTLSNRRIINVYFDSRLNNLSCAYLKARNEKEKNYFLLKMFAINVHRINMKLWLWSRVNNKRTNVGHFTCKRRKTDKVGSQNIFEEW